MTATDLMPRSALGSPDSLDSLDSLDSPDFTDVPDSPPVAARVVHRTWRGSWGALAVTSVARAALSVLLSLLVWSLVPALLGWHITVVMSASMEPRLTPGDIAISRPVPPARIHPGQVLLVADPDHPGRLRLHRLVSVRADGRLTLRGDANAQNDSTPVTRSAVRGVGSLRVPYLGTAMYWASTGNGPGLALLAAMLAVLVAAAFCFRPDDADTDTVPLNAGTDPETAHRDDPAPAARGAFLRRPARGIAAGLVVLLLALASVLSASPAHGAGRFTATATNQGDRWNAATYFTCANAAIGDGARFAWPLSEAALSTTATDITGNALNGTYSLTGVTYRTPGPCNGKTGVTLNGTSGVVSLNATATSLPDISFEVWFKTTGTHGGVLESLTTTSGTTNTTSMALAVTATGTLTLAISAGGTKSVSTTAAYNDNAWHLAVGVVGANGMALYVDNAAPVTSTAVTSAATATGTPRVGFGNHSSLNTGSNDYFQGSVAYAALYKLSLPAAKVAEHYAAA